MDEQERNRIRIGTLLVEEVQFKGVEPVDGYGSFKMWQSIQLFLVRRPIEFLLPVLGYAFDVVDGNASFPAAALYSLGEFGEG